MPPDSIISPYGGKLINLLLPPERREEAKKAMAKYPSVVLSQRQLCDLELLINGGFSPLDGFMSKADYEGVVDNLRLENSLIWPMPIVLDIAEETADQIKNSKSLALYDSEGLLLAILRVGYIWKPDKEKEALKVYGTVNKEHPGAAYLFEQTNPYYVGGRIEAVNLPAHYDFLDLRKTPAELREHFVNKGKNHVVAFQTRNPMHRAHKEITMRAVQETGAHLLIHPVVGLTKPGDIDHCTRVRCYKKLLDTYPKDAATLSLLPLAMRMAGPREALWHAIIRRNYGCGHFIVGRDHAGPGLDSAGKPFYAPYEAQELVGGYQEDIGVNLVKMKKMVYVKEANQYFPIDEIPEKKTVLQISGTELRSKLRDGEEIPGWFSYQELVDELRKVHPPKHQRGLVLFFTGLSGSGKSTIANHLYARFVEEGDRSATLLDGDIVRKYLSSELGFSKEHRDLNVLRVGFVAGEIVKNRGVAITALISPYAETRAKVRKMIEEYGDFIEIHISTPLEICEQRDRKGLYAKARAGFIKGFTGIDDPYEAPINPEITIDTSTMSPQEASRIVFDYLSGKGYLPAEKL